MDKDIEELKLSDRIQLTYDMAIKNGKLHAYGSIVDDINAMIEANKKEIDDIQEDIDNCVLTDEEESEAYIMIDELKHGNSICYKIITLIINKAEKL